MEIAITTALILLIITVVVVMYWSITVSKQLSVVVFGVIFFGIAIAIVIWQGFTQQAFEFVGILALALFITWARFSKSIADTTRARSFLEKNLSRKNYDTCKICGKKLPFHRKPKNLSQLLSGGLTGENYGAEFNIPFDAFFFNIKRPNNEYK